jgi:hypothetical protein
VTFDAGGSTPSHDANDQPRWPISRYEWDLDGNGSYETVTQAAQVTHRYSGTARVDVGLRVTDSAGQQASTTEPVATSEQETAIAPESGCASQPSDYGCGTASVASPAGGTVENPPAVAQPDYSHDPVFDSFFGSFTPMNSPDDRVAATNGGGRLFVIHPSGGADALGGFDADSRAVLFDRPIAARGRTRDVAFYHGEVYVLFGNGDVEVFDRDGTSERVVRAIDASALGTNDPIDYSNLTVAWNELWATASLGEKTGAALIVRDATTGAFKHAVLHTADADCRIGASGRVCSGVNPSLVADPEVERGKAFTPGISAIPELGALVTQCRPILRINDLGVTIAHDHNVLADAGPCSNAEFSDALMGTDSAWGQRHFLQLRKHATDVYDGPEISSVVDEYEVQASGAPNAWGTRPVSLAVRRSWETADGWLKNYQDVSYRSRETQIDWWGPLTEQPSRWLKSPPNQCANYVVSNADIYVVGYEGEHWWDPVAISSAELWVGNADGSNYQRVATSTSAKGQFCLDTRNFADGEHDMQLRVHLPDGSTIQRTAHFRRFDNAAPSTRLVAAEDLARGATTYLGVADDAQAGVATWRIEVQRPGQANWEDACRPDVDRNADSRFECTWNTSNGQYPDGTYQVRAVAVDGASDGGNVGYGKQEEVDVDNTSFWDEANMDTTDDSFDQIVNNPLETDQETAIPDSSAPDNDPGASDPNAPDPECASNDTNLVDVQPVYSPVQGLPVGAPDPQAALVTFLALPQLGPLPVALFQQVSATADSVVYAATENGQIRAVVQIVKAPDGSWIGSQFTACSQFPSATAPVTNAGGGATSGLP